MTALFGTGTVVNYIYGNTSWGDMLTAYNGTAITYDAIGNPLKWRNAVGLTWEGRQLQRTNLAANAYVDYTYNSSGIRTEKTYVDLNGDTWEYSYILDGSKIIKEAVHAFTTNSPAAGMYFDLLYYYDDSGIAAISYNGTKYYYVKNLQGDVIGLVNASGQYVVQYVYDAWGRVVSTTGSMASTLGQYNPFRYRGYYYDRETGWYYLQSRYYDPTVGRFLNADGIVGANGGIEGYNMFAYCGNNPVIRVDDSGALWWAFVVIIIVPVLLSSCSGPDTETLVDTPADSAPDAYFYDYNKAVEEACKIAYDAMKASYDSFFENSAESSEPCKQYAEYIIYIIQYRDGIHDENRYYVTGAETDGSPGHVYTNNVLLKDPNVECIAIIHTHPKAEGNNMAHIFNVNDMEHIKYDQYVVDINENIWKLPKLSPNYTYAEERPTPSACVPGGIATIGFIPVYGQVC